MGIRLIAYRRFICSQFIRVSAFGAQFATLSNGSYPQPSLPSRILRNGFELLFFEGRVCPLVPNGFELSFHHTAASAACELAYQMNDVDLSRSQTLVHIFVFSSPYNTTMSCYTKANHSVYMRFEKREHWHVSFVEAGLETVLPCKLTFTDSGKILELARKGEAWGNLESRQALENAMAAGRGGCYLRLTPSQCARLRRS
jgi:hypothetical protein